jgi:virginiamycin B lyase
MMRARSVVALMLSSALAACAGGSVPLAHDLPGADAVTAGVPARSSSAGRRIPVTVHVTIQGGMSHRTGRAHFISRSTDGVLAQVYAHGDTAHRHAIGENATNVSSGSAACGGQTGYPRSCTVSVPAPAGDDDFAFTTYDVVPKGRQFPGGHVLGLGRLTQTIAAYRANDLSIYIGGKIASIGGVPANLSFPADGRQHMDALILSPEDFNDNPITAGARDPYANPITLTLTQSPSANAMSLSLNGAPGKTSIVSKHSDDSLVLQYDGGGSPGYGATVAISAAGVPAQSIAVSPLFVSSASTLFVAQRLGFVGSSEQATLAISEANAPATVRYTAQANGCGDIVSLGSVMGSGASASVVASNGSTVSASGCSIAVSDGRSTVTIPVTNTLTGGNVGVPGVTISEFPIPSANAQVSQLALGADGAMWFAESSPAAGKIGRIPASVSGSVGQISEFPTPVSAAAPFGIVAAPDGALWFTESGSDAIGSIPTSATPGSSAQITDYPLTAPFGTPQELIVSGGNVWFSDQVASDVGVMNLGGGLAQTYPLPLAAGGGMAVDVAQNVWIAGLNIGSLYEVAPNGTVTTVGIDVGSQILSMAFDGSGNLWMANTGLHRIDELTAGTTAVVSFAVPGAGNPAYLTLGPDGAIWFTDTARNVVGRMTVTGTFAPSDGYAIPTANSQPAGIVNGPDGAMWFAESSGNNIGRIVPSGTTPQPRGRR